MAGFSTYYANLVVNNLFRAVPTTPAGWTNVLRPAGTYIGLFTVAPTDAGGGTEVTGGSYARVAVSQIDGSWALPTGSPAATSNVGAIQFPQASADWGTVVAWGLFDASTAGNLLMWSALTANRSVPNGATASFSAGSLSVTLD
jgi:hypothetical protein